MIFDAKRAPIPNLTSLLKSRLKFKRARTRRDPVLRARWLGHLKFFVSYKTEIVLSPLF